MSSVDIVRAWKDAEYRQSLSEVERAQLPDHPAGLIELTDADLDGVAAGVAPFTFASPCDTTTITVICYTDDCSRKCPSSTHAYCGVCWP
jgi:mersacidin/lichenicidin family type 2 lantibiotic